MPRAVCVGFAVDKVAPGQALHRVFQFSPVIITAPLLCIHSCVIWELDNGPICYHSSMQKSSLTFGIIKLMQQDAERKYIIETSKFK
jgi:hypothetical protein